MQPCVSVIIPVYNIEKHLEKCLDSVIGQTLKDIEIIVVNDGSTDNSPRIIDRYARTDSRIVAIHKANEGLAYARKSGIEAAHGKYVQHLDGDDFLEPDACELLFNRAEETNADIVIMRFLIDSPCVQEEPPFWTQDYLGYPYDGTRRLPLEFSIPFPTSRSTYCSHRLFAKPHLWRGRLPKHTNRLPVKKNRNPQGQASVPLCDSGKFCHTNRNDPKKGRKRLAIP